MEPDCRTNNRSDVLNRLQKTLLLVDSEKMEHRHSALYLLGQYLHDIYNSGLTADAAEDNSLKAPISFAILTRCDDISPDIRAKALTVLFQEAGNVLKFLDETKDQRIFKIEETVDISEMELDVNGQHRFFWYCMTSFEERQRELMAILHRRIDDIDVCVRKAAIIALEKLILADSTFIKKENLKCLKSVFKDPVSLIRRQSLLSLSNILKTYIKNPEIQELWLKCVLPLVNDPTYQVQYRAMSLLEEFFLVGVFISAPRDENLSLAFLRMLTTGDSLVYHKYLKKLFFEWKQENKLRPESVVQLKKYIGTEWEECVWFYISLFSKYCPIPLDYPHLCVQYLSNCLVSGVCPALIEYVVKTLLNTQESLSAEASETLQCVTSKALALLRVPVNLIPMYIEMLSKIHHLRDTVSEFESLSSALVQDCENSLLEIQLLDQPLPDEEVLARNFRTLTECFLLNASYITPRVIEVLKCFCGCLEFPMEVPPNVKAHALVALGKICLQDQFLARELLPMFAEEMLTSKRDANRSNACIILIDMCKLYPYFADQCIPLITLCFKDRVYLIRHQAIVQIINLLQSEYIKWKAHLLFGFLTTLIDKKEVIRELGHYTLYQLLPNYEKQFFFEYIVNSIFVLNRFSPPDNLKITQNVEVLGMFSVPGENRRGDRMIMYEFFLEHMDVKDKVKVIASVCGILTNVAESVYALNGGIECIIRDCFSILTSDGIKIVNLDPIEDMDEPLEGELSIIESRIRRTVLVDPVIKVVNNLTSNVKNLGSDLIHDIVLFLKDLLSDFTDDISDILADDEILLNLLQLEIRKDDAEKHAKIQRKRDLLARGNTGARKTTFDLFV